MFNSKKGNFLKKLYNNTITDEEFIKEKTKHFKDDVSNSGKSFTLILYLLDYCYGDIKAVKRLYVKSGLCRDDYLQPKYAYDSKTKKYTKDKIDYCFIPKAIKYYFNYRTEQQTKKIISLTKHN